MTKEDRSEWIWWKHGVIYHIYPRSFFDSDGDGNGDIPGIIAKLDYLESLQVDAVWLSPVYPSPMIDSGYDITDFKGIDPLYGGLHDFRNLLNQAHQRGIRVIMDLVMNHTSMLHPWFMESRSSRENPKRDWYIWKEGRGKKPPNNWRSAMGGSAWYFDTGTGQYYLHSFFREQPDLNWRNQEMKEAFFSEVRFWLDMGVDGFRLDVVNYIVKDKKFRDNPSDPVIPFMQSHRYTRNRPKSLKIIREFRKLLDSYNDRICIGEIYTFPPGSAKQAAKYLGDGEDSLHMAFDFSLIFSRWNARRYFDCIHEWNRRVPVQGWPCYVLSNHDLLRSINRIPWRRHQIEKAKVAAVLLLTLRGTPFIYYGEEIGMQNRPIPLEYIRDPVGIMYWPFFSGRDKARTPMQWDDSPNNGFTIGTPWLPADNHPGRNTVERQQSDPHSLFQVYRKLIMLRKQYLSMHAGDWAVLHNGRGGVLVYTRQAGDERCIIFLNFTSRKKTIRLPETLSCRVLFSTSGRSGSLWFDEIRAEPFEATVLLQD